MNSLLNQINTNLANNPNLLKGIGVGLLGLFALITSLKKAGPFDPLLPALTFRKLGKPQVKIIGHVEPGWEELKNAFVSQIESGQHLGIQLTVHKEGKVVVELAGAYGNQYSDVEDESNKKQLYSLDSLQVVFSSTKAVTPIVIAKLVEEGRLDYNAPIAQYWPEFAANGKENITLAELLRHESGLDVLSEPIPWKVFIDPDNKDDPLSKRIERSTPKWNTAAGPSKRSYHAITRGLILNELVKKVDPKGRSVGKILEEEIKTPLGINCWIGTPQSQFKNVHRLYQASPIYRFFHVIVPIFTRRFPPHIMRMVDSFMDKKSWLNTRGPATLGPEGSRNFSPDYHTSPKLAPAALMTESPSTNGVFSAKSLGKIMAMLSLGGTIDNQTFLKPETFNKLIHKSTGPAVDSMITLETTFTDGGLGVGLMPFSDKENWYGWMGMGGSIAQFNPVKKVAIAMTVTGMSPLFTDERGLEFVQKIDKILQRI